MPEITVAEAVALAQAEFTQWNQGFRNHNGTPRQPQPHNCGCGTDGNFISNGRAQPLMEQWNGLTPPNGLNRSATYSASGNDVDLLLNEGAPPAMFNFHVPIRQAQENRGRKTEEELETHTAELKAQAQRKSRASAQAALETCMKREGKKPFKINW